MTALCTHLGCLDRELRFLRDLEHSLWERSGGDAVAYAALMAKYKDWLVSQVP